MRFHLLFLLLAWASVADSAERRTDVVVAVERAAPAVVTIEVEVPTQGGFFWFQDPRNSVSEGSGVIIDPAGVVLTNAHVVANAVAVKVHTERNGSFTARVMSLESDLDLAVLQLEGASKLPTIPIGDSDGLLLGEPAIAIGNPFALGQTVSTGIISSTMREVEVEAGLYQSYVQTDAAINPGNSGGALLNIDGELIGINTMIRSGGEGIGWAIPANRAMKVASDLLSYGQVRLPWMGCDFRDLGRRYYDPNHSGGILVQHVHAGGPCHKAGLAAGDFVVSVGERRALSRADLMAHLAEMKPGVTLDVGWVQRDGAQRSAPVTTIGMPDTIVDAAIEQTLGIQVRAATNGLVVDAMTPQGAWARSRLRVGDVIVAVDGQRVKTVDELRRVVTHAKSRHRATALFRVQRGRYAGSLSLPV